jgi:trans-2,3-dihydro-3-hydroxyanthranilate isomerase|eukprot:COSAG02_NODE_2179_length_9586_cov_14.521395_11_plen_323_part_00
MSHPFRLLDVFAERKHQGNQLLVLVDRDEALDDAQLLAITREINFAESAFLCCSDPDGAVRVRIFTPEYEVPFAGHPTLGLAFVAASLGLASSDGSLTLRLNPKLGGGDVAVECEEGVWWMRQTPPVFIEPLAVSRLAGLVPNWEAVVDVSNLDDESLVPEISTGLPYLLIPVKHAAALAAVEVPGGGEQMLADIGRSKDTHPLKLHSSLYFYHRDTRDDDVAGAERSGETRFCARMFCYEQGVWLEDAATGSAAGCLAAHLAQRSPVELPATIEQGVQMGRPSALQINATAPAEGEPQDTWRVSVGGRVVPVAQGTWGDRI